MKNNEVLDQPTNKVFIYSNIKLSEPMLSLLNRALNPAISPLKLDITQVLVNFNRFSRAMIWQEYWYGREVEEEYKEKI